MELLGDGYSYLQKDGTVYRVMELFMDGGTYRVISGVRGLWIHLLVNWCSTKFLIFGFKNPISLGISKNVECQMSNGKRQTEHGKR